MVLKTIEFKEQIIELMVLAFEFSGIAEENKADESRDDPDSESGRQGKILKGTVGVRESALNDNVSLDMQFTGKRGIGRALSITSLVIPLL